MQGGNSQQVDTPRAMVGPREPRSLPFQQLTAMSEKQKAIDMQGHGAGVLSYHYGRLDMDLWEVQMATKSYTAESSVGQGKSEAGQTRVMQCVQLASVFGLVSCLQSSLDRHLMQLRYRHWTYPWF